MCARLRAPTAIRPQQVAPLNKKLHRDVTQQLLLLARRLTGAQRDGMQDGGGFSHSKSMGRAVFRTDLAKAFGPNPVLCQLVVKGFARQFQPARRFTCVAIVATQGFRQQGAFDLRQLFI